MKGRAGREDPALDGLYGDREAHALTGADAHVPIAVAVHDGSAFEVGEDPVTACVHGHAVAVGLGASDAHRARPRVVRQGRVAERHRIDRVEALTGGGPVVESDLNNASVLIFFSFCFMYDMSDNFVMTVS